MADELKDDNSAHGLTRRYKEVNPGEFAEVVALEPGSIGAGGGTSSTVDVTDRSARLLGHTTIDNASIAVTGTFWQATQPISGSVSVSNFPATQAVTGTFWQATQPVSLASVPAHDVTQATAANLNAQVVGNIAVDVAAAGNPLSAGGVYQAGAPAPIQANANGRMTRFWTDNRGALHVVLVREDSGSALGTATDADNIGNATPLFNANKNYNYDSVNSVWFRARGNTTIGQQVGITSSTVGSTISAANAAVTLTISASGAGLFHYITSLEIVNINPTATAIAGSAVTLSYTTTNLPGTLAWTCGNALAAGAEKVVTRITYNSPIKSSVANTATTIVAPAIGTGGLCRVTATYYAAP